MQTFLPYPSFDDSLTCLDYRRLGKQRVEAYTILRVISGEVKAWQNHPAVRMWKGFESALKLYYNKSIEEWVRRGFNNTLKPFEVADIAYPTWLGDENFHKSHQSNLLRKDFEFYSKYNWGVPDNLPYVWPVR